MLFCSLPFDSCRLAVPGSDQSLLSPACPPSQSSASPMWMLLFSRRVWEQRRLPTVTWSLCVSVSVPVGGAGGLGQYRNPGCLTPEGGLWGFTVQTAAHTGSSPGLLSQGTAEALFILVVKVLVNFPSHSFDLFNQPFQGATLFVQDIGRQQDSR